MASQDPVNPSHATFDLFVQAQYCKDVKQHFAELCRQLDINPKDFRSFYSKLKERLNYWKAKALWTKLDKRASHPDYQQGKACTKNKVLKTTELLFFVFDLKYEECINVSVTRSNFATANLSYLFVFISYFCHNKQILKFSTQLFTFA